MFECATATFCSMFVASMPDNFSSLASHFCRRHYSLAVSHDALSSKYHCSGAVQMLALFEKEGAAKLLQWLRQREAEPHAAYAPPDNDRCRPKVAFSSEGTDAAATAAAAPAAPAAATSNTTPRKVLPAGCATSPRFTATALAAPSAGKFTRCLLTESSAFRSRKLAQSSARHAASERRRPLRTREHRASGSDSTGASVSGDCTSCSRSGHSPGADCTSTPGAFLARVIASVSPGSAIARLSRAASCSGERLVRKAVAAKPFALLRCRRCPFVTLRLGFLRRHEAAAHRRELLGSGHRPPTDRRCCARGSSCSTRRCASASCRGAAATNSADGHHAAMATPIVGNRRQTRQAVAHPPEIARARSAKLVASPRRRGDRRPGTAVTERLRRCPNCDYVTASSSHLSRHVRVTHGNLRPFLCDACGSAFKTNDALRQHRTYVHGPGRLPFACSTCSKTFRSRYHLAQHAGRHTTERSFLCHVCGAAFKTLSCASRHIRHLHTNPGGFSCSICSKRFNSSFSLKRHGSTHSI